MLGIFFHERLHYNSFYSVDFFYKLNMKKCPEQNSARLLVDLLNSGRGSRIPGRPFKVSALASRLLGGRKLMVREGRTENTQSGEKAKAQEAFSFHLSLFETLLLSSNHHQNFQVTILLTIFRTGPRPMTRTLVFF